eukprot:11172550-Lingulodinium_polyedra.AAC.1
MPMPKQEEKRAPALVWQTYAIAPRCNTGRAIAAVIISVLAFAIAFGIAIAHDARFVFAIFMSRAGVATV